MDTPVVVPLNYIEIVDGDPRIAGTRMKVAFIGNLVVRLGESVESVLENYPLTHSQVHAALAYYYDHKAELDAWLDQPLPAELLEQSRLHTEDLLARYERMKAEQAKNGTTDTEGYD